MHRAGDWITVTDGSLKGQTFEIRAVRMFATDCSQRKHDLIGTCDHCRGVCLCRYRQASNETTAAAEEN